MSLSTEKIKQIIIAKHSNVDLKSLKRVLKQKVAGNVTRLFSSNIGAILVTSNPSDENVISIEVGPTGPVLENKKKSKRGKYSRYFFALGESSFDDILNTQCVPICIVKKTFWERHQSADDQPQEEIMEDLLEHLIESPNDTSDFVGIYEDKMLVLKILESLGMEYNNEIADYYTSMGERFYRKP